MNELTISLDPHRKTPLYEQIYGFIREEIRGGRIRAGERLPSARALSGYLSVSRSTVDLAYEQLVSEGYLESVPCKGYFVCEIEGLYRLDEKKEETKEDDAAEQMPFSYDFAVTGTAPGGFPQNSWKKTRKKSCWTQMTACSSSGMRRASTVFGRQSATICTTHAA